MQVDMNDDRYVAAIEISSSKIVAVVGKTYPDGHLDIIASEQERGVEGVKYGIIQNLEETSMRIARIIDRLERKPAVAPRRITGVFVGLSGRSVRSISTEVHLNLPDDTEITDEILDRLRGQALSTALDNSLEVVDAIPRLYTVGKTETASPKGTVGNSISATFDLIVCRPELRRNLTRTITDKNGLDIEGFVVTALAAAQVILTSEEKRLGCMLVDMGAETTTVSIYKRGHLNYFATLPLGGRNITRDITSLSVLEEKAEDIKITSGNALPRETSSSLNMNGIRMSDVSNLIVARAEEIVANIVEQINYAKLDESMLPGGIICIGGGARLNGMLDLLGSKTGLPVKRGQLPSYIRMEEVRASLSEMPEVASVLYAGAMDSDAECLESPDRETLPGGGIPNPDNHAANEGTRKDGESPARPNRGRRFFGKLGEKLAGMFSGSEEDDSDLL